MEQLKTLNDLDICFGCDNESYSWNIRQEAIKWIKELIKEREKFRKVREEIRLQMEKLNSTKEHLEFHLYGSQISVNILYCQGAIDYFIKFFNITDEELK